MERQSIFYTGGALPPDYPYYIIRRADLEAINLLNRDKLIYTIAPRQMGKTSFLIRLALQLENQRWYCCFVDLAILKNLERPKWYRYLGEMVAKACKVGVIRSALENQLDFRRFLLDEVGLERLPIKLTLFFDELESLLALDFSDGFLMTLRDLYQQRDSYPGQFLVAFAGFADPRTLVKDPNISPFNVAKELVLEDFTEPECRTLTGKLPQFGITVDANVYAYIYRMDFRTSPFNSADL